MRIGCQRFGGDNWRRAVRVRCGGQVVATATDFAGSQFTMGFGLVCTAVKGIRKAVVFHINRLRLEHLFRAANIPLRHLARLT